MIRKIFNKIVNKYRFKLNRVLYGKELHVAGTMLIRNDGRKITIGDCCTINSDKYAVPLGYQDRTILWCLKNGSINIGNNCGITNSTFCSSSSITIEDDVLIGGGCKLFDTDFHSLRYEKRIDIINDNDRATKPILVKKGAFIGAGSTILKGVSIGSMSIIGAGSVVTKNVPDGEIWAGNPAKFIRKI